MKTSFFATLKAASATTVSAVSNKVSAIKGSKEGAATEASAISATERESIRKLLASILAQQDLVMKAGFMEALELKMAAQGVALADVSTVTTAIMNDPGAFADVYRAHTRVLPKAPAELAGEMHDEIMESVKALGNYTDGFIWVALQVYGGNSISQCQYTVKFANFFDNDQKKVGAYIRDYIQEEKKLNAKGMAYYTADAIRVTGDLLQNAIVMATMLTNKVAFQMPAEAIDKAAQRPEELKGLNLIADGMRHPLQNPVAENTMNLVIQGEKKEEEHAQKVTALQEKAIKKQQKREAKEEKASAAPAN